MKSLGDQAREFRESKGWDVLRMAKEVGTSRQNIEGLEKAGNRIPKYLGSLSLVIGRPVDEMLALAELAPRALFAAEPWMEFQPVRPGKFSFVPVLGQGVGGTMPERIWTDGDYPAGATDAYAEVMSTDPHAFIIRVVGTSMVPKFSPGDYALIEPGTDPDIEDDVLVRLSDGQTLIKRLLSRRGAIRLGSYNDTAVLTYEKDEVTWLYYVAYPVPARKIKTRS